MNLSDIYALRATVWSTHPAITEKAVLPTPSVTRSYGLLKTASRTHRSSMALWAHPQTGKSSCIRAFEVNLAVDFPGSAIFVYESKVKAKVAEGAFLEDVLGDLEYEPAVARSLTGKRNQVKNALCTWAMASGRFFLLVDEAQELSEFELAWLKHLINWLVKKGIFVHVVLFGQVELLQMREELMSNGRSDLDFRYTEKMYEFEKLASVAELSQVLALYDDGTDFPKGSGLSYTEFLWPTAFAHGFRLKPLAGQIWEAFKARAVCTGLDKGLSMVWIAKLVGELATRFQGHDELVREFPATGWDALISAIAFNDAVPKARQRRKKGAPGASRGKKAA